MGNRFSFLSEHKSFARPWGWVLGCGTEGAGRMSGSTELVRQTRTALEGTNRRIRFWETGGGRAWLSGHCCRSKKLWGWVRKRGHLRWHMNPLPRLDWAKMVSFRALMLQTQRRWKETTGFCLYKGTEPHFNVIMNSHHPLPTQTSFSPLETFSSHSGRNITSTAKSE